MSEEFTKGELKFRMIAYLLMGLMGGIVMSQVWTAIVYLPNMNPHNPYIPSNGTTTTNPLTTTPTTTIPTGPTFIIARFESDNALFHVGYDSYNGDSAVRFVLNVAEIGGFAGTLKLRFDIYTDHNIWGTRENIGGDITVYMGALEVKNDYEVHFLIEPEMYDLNAIDFDSAEVVIV